ncbi:thymus specific serine peptidase [Salpingoeca rosetta]|uniref:Thymus specific serine peptidase n=1 Tax=Salpingoeca rosetta (strain ATCC 50818 / BSB-021) TaxID=946362 RepID=F2U2N2_SALR5|nr:thymus specific serine peptidase [Salpingoeca rosetta]EGD81876.1 thymus specific serine peptidase [Salpingoeca rosetta]|eukprot:XP_004996059.1 thymus specific serine peptidase [Salpingoeca rosetta]
MMGMTRLLLLAVVALAAQAAAAAAAAEGRTMVFGGVGEKSVGPPARYFTQWQDHFDGTNVNTWQQAYYVNDTFWKGDANAPVFLCVGGEGPPIDGSVVVSSVHCNGAVEMLPETGAIMFAVEHRYYGCHNMSACPVTSFLKPKDALRFLSSRQALADLAGFHAYATATYGLKPTNKWVSFGGSYPGMLAGWFRLKFPHLVHASVASSAPVQAIVDMVGYNDVVAEAYAVSNNNVGGSPACRKAIADGHAMIGQMFSSDSGRTRLANLFGHNAKWYENKLNQASFAGFGVAYFPAQGNDPACTDPACNIGRICAVMTNTSLGDEVSRLAAIRNMQDEWLSQPFETVNRKHSLMHAAGNDAELPDFWSWQVCTEFGFFQTCEVGSKCFFTQGYDTLQSQMEFCSAVFGIPATKVRQNIADSNLYYGGRNSGGSCLIYPNGEVDPWHAQSILNSTNPNVKTLWVPGASHHAWTHPSLPTDQPSVVAARKAIRDYVTSTLNQEC